MNPDGVFDGIIGHEAVKHVLTRALERPHHGYLLIGPDGAGAHGIAERFVRALTDHPAHLLLASHPDIALLEREPAESGKGMKKEIAVKSARELRTRMFCRPAIAKRVVAYIPEADYLNEEGVNALLKCVEEPPAGAVFVLVSHAIARLPETLQSRLVRLELGRVSTADLSAWLTARYPDISPLERSKALCVAEGRPGYACRYIEDESFRELVHAADTLVASLVTARGGGEAIAAIAESSSRCDSADDPVQEWRKTLQLWESALRRVWQTDQRHAVRIGKAFIVAERAIGSSVSPRLHLEIELVKAFARP